MLDPACTGSGPERRRGKFGAACGGRRLGRGCQRPAAACVTGLTRVASSTQRKEEDVSRLFDYPAILKLDL